MPTKSTTTRARKSAATKAVTKAAPPKIATNATRDSLGTFTSTGKDGETRKCSGSCGLRLPVRKFPTTKAAGVRVAECRSCRDARTKAAAMAKAGMK